MVLLSPLGDRVLAKPMKNVSLARLTLSLVSCAWSSGSSCKSCMECPGLKKCSATPDVSVCLFIISRRCSLNLSLMRRPVCHMYWQSVFLSCQHLYLNAALFSNDSLFRSFSV